MVFDYDIIIIGAGPAGISAAGTLKKQGLKIALLEKTSQIGGSYYASMTNLLKPGPESQLFSEIRNDICDMQGFALIDPTTLNDRYFSYIEGQDIELCLENNVYGAQVVMGSILSVDVSGPEGNRTLSAKVFIDASGSAFLRMIKPRKPETSTKSITVLAGGMGLHSDVRQRIGALAGHINANLASVSVEISPTINRGLYLIRITGDGEEIRKSLPAIMRLIGEFDGGSKEAFLIHGAGELYSEDFYTQDARFVLGPDDIAAGRKYEDTIIDCGTNAGRIPIPYRSLLALGVNNLLLCGRSIGAKRELSGALDTVKAAYATGQAAALAALYCIRHNQPLDQADIGAISNRCEDAAQDYVMEDEADIYIENIDVEDLVELAPEDDAAAAYDDAMDRPVENPGDREWSAGFEPEVPEFDGAGYGGENDVPGGYGEYQQQEQPAADEPAWNEPEASEQDDDKPFFTEEKIISTMQDPIYDLISDEAECGSAEAAQITQSEYTGEQDAAEEKEAISFGGVSSLQDSPQPDFAAGGGDTDLDALAKSIEEATRMHTLQNSAVSGQVDVDAALDFPEEDIIDKLPAYVLFDSENNALDFTKTDKPQDIPQEKPKERSSVDELLSLLDVLPDQLPEGLYDFLKENSKARKQDGESE